MPFDFTNPDYAFHSRWSDIRAEKGKAILKTGIKERFSTYKIHKQLVSAGLSYRKTTMLDDIALAKMTERSRDPAHYGRAVSFARTVEAARQKLGKVTRREAVDFVLRWQTESLQSEEDENLAAELEALDYSPGS